jgi:hypothetical protein
MAILGGIMIAITIVAIIMACCVRLTKHCICVSIEIPILLIISVVLIVFGALMVTPAQGGSKFIHDNCNLANEGKFDDMHPYVRRVFEPIADFDKEYKTAVTRYMCTYPLCQCPGSPWDKHYR